MSDIRVKINFDKQLFDHSTGRPMVRRDIRNENGNTIVNEVPTTGKIIAQEVLFSLLRGEEDMPGSQKADNYALAIKLAAGGEIELTPEEAKRIKERVRRGCGPIVVGQMDELIDAAFK